MIGIVYIFFLRSIVHVNLLQEKEPISWKKDPPSWLWKEKEEVIQRVNTLKFCLICIFYIINVKKKFFYRTIEQLKIMVAFQKMWNWNERLLKRTFLKFIEFRRVPPRIFVKRDWFMYASKNILLRLKSIWTNVNKLTILLLTYI